MPSTLLSLATPTTGTESGTWGDLVNNGLTSYLDIAIAGSLAVTITTTDVTLTNTSGTNAATGITSTTAQYAILNISGAKTAARNLNLPASSRQYLINNAGTGGFLLTVRGSTPTTGITLIDGEKALIAWNGTDYVKIAATPFNMGIGSGNVNSNTVYGKTALAVNTTGSSNVAIGQNALAVNTTGSSHVAIGSGALIANTTGDSHVAIGASALDQYTGSGVSNVAIGLRAGKYTSGSWNISLGQDAMGNAVTSSGENIAIGASAMYGSFGNALGTGSIAIGSYALYSNRGNANIGIGAAALYTNTTGVGNIAIGTSPLRSNTTGQNNTGIGFEALYANIDGQFNTAIGTQALKFNTSGLANVGIGYTALNGVTTGSGNTMLNPQASTTLYAPVFNPTTQDNRFCMGSTAVTNAYIQVAWTVVSDARDKTDFAPVPHGLDFVCKLKPTAYRYKVSRDATEGHGPVRYGFKAQDVLAEEGANPVIVDNEDPEKLRFNDQSMIAVLVNAIKEQTQIIKTLSDRVAQLESNP